MGAAATTLSLDDPVVKRLKAEYEANQRSDEPLSDVALLAKLKAICNEDTGASISRQLGTSISSSEISLFVSEKENSEEAHRLQQEHEAKHWSQNSSLDRWTRKIKQTDWLGMLAQVFTTHHPLFSEVLSHVCGRLESQ